jgi:hypothetical protein
MRDTVIFVTVRGDSPSRPLLALGGGEAAEPYRLPWEELGTAGAALTSRPTTLPL